MSARRRIRSMMAVAAAAAGMATMMTATPADAAVKDGPRPVVNAVKPVKAGKPTWVKAYWITYRDVCDARVTVAAPDVDVLYPSNTGDHTSFSRNDTLASDWTDYTSFRVTARARRTHTIKLKVTITYTQLPRGTFRPGVDPERVPCKGKELARTSWVKLPVLAKPTA